MCDPDRIIKQELGDVVKGKLGDKGDEKELDVFGVRIQMREVNGITWKVCGCLS